MTVCVAAICEGNTIIGASDRMLTSGTIEFEPQRSKIRILSNSIFAMLAGDSALQDEVWQKLWLDVNERIKAEPQNWWNVRDVAELYSHYYGESKRIRAERCLLAPLGLDSKTFIARQKEMDEGLVNRLTKELQRFEMPDVQAILTGRDNIGTHIYVANNEDVYCYDSVGFASIGIGAGHANSQMMFSGHTTLKSFPETLLLVYSAKRRAEVAPGVGKHTDMFIIWPKLGTSTIIGQDERTKNVLPELLRIYRKEQIGERTAANKAKNSAKSFIKKLAREAETALKKVQQPILLDNKEGTPNEKK